MAKKIIERSKVNNSLILESYKPSEKLDGPILGTFSVNEVILENTISKNNTFYPTETLANKNAFGSGGRFFREDGSLIPAKLMGSLDHPIDGSAPEVRLESNAISWRELGRNGNSWNGKADILNTPAGKILKTHLDYAKEVGGGDFFGVSIRAVGESVEQREASGSYTKIVPDGFEILSIDFVYEPSFGNAATFTEGKKVTIKPLYESIKKLAEEDSINAKVYEEYAKFIENENKHLDPTIADFRDAYEDTVINKLDELRKAWALTFEGLAEDSIKDAIVHFKEIDNDANPKAHIFSGKQFNEIYHLTNHNRYPDGLNIVAFTGYSRILAIQVGARWLPDIIWNNANREGNPDDSVFENVKFKGNDKIMKVESKILDGARAEYIQKIKDEINKMQNAIYELDKMTEEEFNKSYKGKNKESLLVKLNEELGALRAELELLSRNKAEVNEVVEDKKQAEVTEEATHLDETLETITEDEDEVSEDEEEVSEDEEEDEVSEDEEEVSEDEDEEELPEDEEESPEEEEPTINDVVTLLNELKAELEEIRLAIMPVDDQPLFDEEELPEELEEDPEVEELPEGEEEELPNEDLDDLTELSDEELLAYLDDADL